MVGTSTARKHRRSMNPGRTVTSTPPAVRSLTAPFT